MTREEEYYATASRLRRRVMKPNPARPKAKMAWVAGSGTATTGDAIVIYLTRLGLREGK
jgi:hypothetical protein